MKKIHENGHILKYRRYALPFDCLSSLPPMLIFFFPNYYLVVQLNINIEKKTIV